MNGRDVDTQRTSGCKLTPVKAPEDEFDTMISSMQRLPKLNAAV
jgi:hypothetical protein